MYCCLQGLAPLRARVKLRTMSDDAGFRELIGTEVSGAEEGRAVARLEAEGRHLNPNGTVHGGVVYTLVDVSMAEALRTMSRG